MKCIKVQKALLLSLLFSSALFADAIQRIEYTLGRVLKDVEEIIVNGNAIDCMAINQTMITDANGTYTITTPGSYCVTEDVTGTIVIASNSVCLSLDCHIVNADGNDNAIVITTARGVSVFGGTVTGALEAGIFAVDSSGINLYDLYFVGNTSLGVDLEGLSGARISNLEFDGGQLGGGDKALRVNESENININSINAYDFTNVTESIITLENCNNINLTDVVAANCEKALNAPASELSNATGIISVYYCWDTNLLRCHADNNYATNDNVLFGPISVIASSNFTVEDCTANNNYHEVVSQQGFAPFFFYLNSVSPFGESQESSAYVDRCQANGNTATDITYFLHGFHVESTSDVILNNCQANGNSLQQTYTVVDGDTSGLAGIYILDGTDYFDDGQPGSQNWIVRGCQANDNVVINGGSQISGSYSDVSGLFFQGAAYVGKPAKLVIQDSQFCFNNMQTTAAQQKVQGIHLQDAIGVTVINCTCDTNLGGDAATGIRVLGHYGFSQDIEIIGCTANYNATGGSVASGIRVGVDTESIAQRITIRDCVTNDQEGDDVTNLYGIFFDGNQLDSSIIGCQCNYNNTGVYLSGSNGNIRIANTTASDNTLGFVLDSAQCSVVQDCTAIYNDVGFTDSSDPFSTMFFGNFAQCNGDGSDYSIENGVISLQSIDFSSGDMTVVSGNAALGARFTNMNVGSPD